MTRRAPRFVCFAAVCVSCIQASSNDGAWRQDLSYLANRLPALRFNFYSSVSPNVFNTAVSTLNSAIPSLTDAEVVTGLAGIVALLNDPHTNLLLPQAAFPMHYAPVKLQWFSDGLFVTGASSDYARAAGARVTRIGSLNVNDAYQAVSTVISHENDEWLRYLSPQYLNNADVLEALKVISDRGVVHMEFVDLSGTSFSFDMTTVGSAVLTAKAPDGGTGFVALYRRNTSQFYWSMWLADAGMLYFKYNSCENTPGLPFAQFATQLLSTFDSNAVRALVIDLRGNTGGDSTVINPLLTGLQQRAGRFGSGGTTLSVLIDEGTISSALLNAESLSGLGFATLLGSPTGGTPNHYGNVSSFALPNCGLVVTYATQFFTSAIQTDALYPDISVPITSADFQARFDPALAAVGLPASPGHVPSTISVVNAASQRSGTGVAPGSIASAFGDFSPVPSGDANSIPWPVSIAGLQVLVNGVVAPLLTVRPTQINFQIPSATAVGLARISVEWNGSIVAQDVFAAAAADPGIFIASSTDYARPGVIANTDATLNNEVNVARRGSVIQIYATGQGATSPAVPDGAPGGSAALSYAQLPVTVMFGYEPGQVLYSGLSPALPGVWQINVQVPDDSSVSGATPVYLISGGVASAAVTLWVEK